MDKTFRVWMVIFTIVLFYVFSWLFLRIQFGSLYNLIIQPLFWILIALYSHYAIFNNFKHIFEYKKNLILLLFTASLAYIVVFYSIGIIASGFAKNPYNNTLMGIIYNLWTFGLVLVLIEIFRSSAINANTKINHLFLNIFLVLFITAISLNYFNIGNDFSDIYSAFKFIGMILIPLLMLNNLLTTSAYFGGPIPAMIYHIMINISIWAAPILPDHNWIVIALLGSVTPFLTFLVFNNTLKRRELKMSRAELATTDPKGWIIRFTLIILTLLFFLGIMPIYPINIISKSMHPAIEIGDVVLVRKVDIESIVVGDIIQFQRNNYTVIHRVIEISKKDGIIYLNTKGDNNRDIDKTITNNKNFLGKVEFKIPKLGLPNVWLKNNLNQIDDAGIGSQ